MNAPITVFDQLPDKARVRELVKAFSERYGEKPQYIARAPGRVSIIGEHIDYAGLSVMPAAIDRDVLMACRVGGAAAKETTSSDETHSSSIIRIANVNPKFAPEEVVYPSGKEGPVLDQKAHSWVNYFKAGLKGVLKHLTPEEASQAIDLRILADGNVPPAGGLSSSAAMVVSSAIAVLQAYGATSRTRQNELAEIAIESERLVGVNSGGMDQSASIFSRKNALLNVGFVPKLVATLVPLPKTQPPITYVIANTLVTSEKQKTAKYNYNLRVVEMRVASVMLAEHLGLAGKTALDLPTPKHVMDLYFGQAQTHQGSDFLIERRRRLGIMLDIVEELFQDSKEGMEWDQVYKRLGGIDEQAFIKRFHPDFEIEADKLQLYKRIKHAYSEARRVYQYRGLLEDTADNSPDLAQKLGKLMDDSHASCRDLFNCSCPELDEICEIAKKNGSYGSRLTGAGFGGCSVHLVAEDQEQALIEAFKREYYAKRFPNLSDSELQAAVFATKPEEGACLYTL